MFQKVIERLTNTLSNILLQTATYGVDLQLLKSIFDINNATVEKLAPEVKGLFKWIIAFEPLPAIWMQYGDKKGGNSLGTNPSDGNAFGTVSQLFPSIS